MGGGGSMAAANQSLKANRKLVGKRKDTRFSFIHTDTEKAEYNLPECTPETLILIQEKMDEENKKIKQKRLILISFFAILLFLILAVIFS